MDADCNIYLSKEVSLVDRARLEGYLRSRAEIDRLDLIEQRLRALEAQGRLDD